MEFIAYRILYYVYLQGNKKYQNGSSDLADIMAALSEEAFRLKIISPASSSVFSLLFSEKTQIFISCSRHFKCRIIFTSSRKEISAILLSIFVYFEDFNFCPLIHFNKSCVCIGIRRFHMLFWCVSPYNWIIIINSFNYIELHLI